MICKFFCPWNNWTWFATEGSQDDDDFRFFGYVVGLEEEFCGVRRHRSARSSTARYAAPPIPAIAFGRRRIVRREALVRWMTEREQDARMTSSLEVDVGVRA